MWLRAMSAEGESSPAGSIETKAPWKAPKRVDHTTTPAEFIIAGIQKKIMRPETKVAGISRFKGPYESAKYCWASESALRAPH